MKNYVVYCFLFLLPVWLHAQTAQELFTQGNAAYNGGNYALAAAKVLIETDLKAEEIARKSLKVASDICVFTNNNVTIEKI